MTKKLIMSGLTLVTGLNMTAHAQQYKEVGPISYAVPFLTIAPDARSGAMGDVGIGLSPNANSQHYNVSKIAMSEKKAGISLSYSPWLKDIVPDVSLIYAAGYYKFGENDNQAVSASLRYFNLGQIQYRSETNADDGIGKPYEMAFDVGYSRKLSENLSIGAALRYINSNIAAGNNSSGSGYKPANAFAADLGLYYTKPTQIDEDRSSVFNLGVVLRNVGSRVTYSQARKDFLPAQLGLGAGYAYQIDIHNKITGAIEFNKLLVPAAVRKVSGTDTFYDQPRDKSVVSGILSSFAKAPGMYGTTVGLGAEYSYQDQFFVRAGYFYEHKDLGNRQFFAVGVGAKYSMFGLDFSYLVPSGSGIARNPLSNTLRVSLLFDFDKMVKEDKGS